MSQAVLPCGSEAVSVAGAVSGAVTGRRRAAANSADPSTPIPSPYTVVVDRREQRPFPFLSPIRVASARRTYTVSTQRGTLASGDYSIAGLESEIAIERKSLTDLFSTLGQGRARFERELARLAAMRCAAVVVEADWSTIFTTPPTRSQLSPRTIFMSVVSWTIRFPSVHWWMMPTRDVAEATTIRILDGYWRKRDASSRGDSSGLSSTMASVDFADLALIGASGDELASFDEFAEK